MGVVQLRQVERQFVQKQLLAHYDLAALQPVLHEPTIMPRKLNTMERRARTRREESFARAQLDCEAESGGTGQKKKRNSGRI